MGRLWWKAASPVSSSLGVRLAWPACRSAPQQTEIFVSALRPTGVDIERTYAESVCGRYGVARL